MKGWIYVATMTNTTGVVKIGWSRFDPDERAKELSTGTGVPGIAEIKYSAWVADPDEFEVRVHKALDKERLKNKEWFKCSIQRATEAIQRAGVILYEEYEKREATEPDNYLYPADRCAVNRCPDPAIGSVNGSRYCEYHLWLGEP